MYIFVALRLLSEVVKWVYLHYLFPWWLIEKYWCIQEKYVEFKYVLTTIVPIHDLFIHEVFAYCCDLLAHSYNNATILIIYRWHNWRKHNRCKKRIHFWDRREMKWNWTYWITSGINLFNFNILYGLPLPCCIKNWLGLFKECETYQASKSVVGCFQTGLIGINFE